MGGQLGVESEEGKGACFWFTVALLESRLTLPAASELNCVLDGLQILIVDDNATNREILKQQLGHWGMVTATADSGKQGIETLKMAQSLGRPFDLVILDMQMPVMSGIDMAKTLQHDPDFANLKKIILTSVGLRGDAQLTREAGVQAYLTKPVRQSELYNCIQSIFSMEQQRFVTRHTLQDATPWSEKRILVAEDNLINQQVTAGILQSFGCLVDLVTDGAQALQALAGTAYDMVMMDCQMPVLDGYAAAAAIRKRENEGERIPIVALTAHVLEGTKEDCLAAGMDDYLAKPFTKNQMRQILARWFSDAP